jgi:hypothetical protein
MEGANSPCGWVSFKLRQGMIRRGRQMNRVQMLNIIKVVDYYQGIIVSPGIVQLAPWLPSTLYHYGQTFHHPREEIKGNDTVVIVYKICTL